MLCLAKINHADEFTFVVVIGNRPSSSVKISSATVQPDKPVTVSDEELNEAEVAFRSKVGLLDSCNSL
jgi:hypothetical protein